MTTVTDDRHELAAEHRFLAAARAALGAMHTEVVSTETPQVSSEDSDEIYQNTVYRLARERRAQALVDVDLPLFFGRLDFEDGAVPVEGRGRDGGGSLHVGRRHVRDADGEPLVLDWRAPVSRAFYQAHPGDRQGVVRRRRYGFSESGDLTGFEDELLVGRRADAGRANQLLAAEIERPRTGPMRDIVATIQPEQDELVRAPLFPTLCIQGAPGTGKTAVGLHRLAYLLFTERERLSGGVVVVGPNTAFLGYISRVLPALGEVSVRQTTVEDLLMHGLRAGPEDHAEVARVKGDPRMEEVLRKAVWSGVGRAPEALVYAKGPYRYRVPAGEIDDAVELLAAGKRYDAGRKGLAQRIAHLVLRQMEARAIVTDDRVQNAVARSTPVKRIVDAAWPALTPQQVLFRLLTDPEYLGSVARDVLTDDEQRILLGARPGRSPRTARWSPADAALLDELAHLVTGHQASIKHMVIDEAQDLTAMQCRALARRCTGGSLTVLGDVAQSTAPGAVSDWRALTEHLGMPDARIEVLDRGYRVPQAILDFAARLLPTIAPQLSPPSSWRNPPEALQIVRVPSAAAEGEVLRTCRRLANQGGSVGVIAPDREIAAIHALVAGSGLDAALLDEDGGMPAARVVCVPARLAKGLEFDAVLVVEPAAIAAAEQRGLQRLYVCLTRAVSTLVVVHARPLPRELVGAGTATRPERVVPVG